MHIIDRDGYQKEFNKDKIKQAISKAFDSLDYTIEESTLNEITDSVKVWDNITVEEIQDIVIETLRDFGFDEVADAYLIYRAKKEESRKFIQEHIDSSFFAL